MKRKYKRQKWIYRCIDLFKKDVGELNILCNKQAKDGYELVTVVVVDDLIVSCFKRPMGD